MYINKHRLYFIQPRENVRRIVCRLPAANQPKDCVERFEPN
ncbi:MAG: hypothetical protein AVDCRST_MAG74-1991 [uncultured Pyrinomonadaceae bacterium]|uniref:Uncharacterized protein n=1 Tax=uncultured Pyrinomonadaceae bacterium TaxID=2283094 RepID=A0A6J4NSA2_9BACT|nr:MAG: hypothetical protein AVDCRST_MAG74-1991 [uncultured Pyrinomonadaceae bacterium]